MGAAHGLPRSNRRLREISVPLPCCGFKFSFLLAHAAILQNTRRSESSFVLRVLFGCVTWNHLLSVNFFLDVFPCYFHQG